MWTWTGSVGGGAPEVSAAAEMTLIMLNNGSGVSAASDAKKCFKRA